MIRMFAFAQLRELDWNSAGRRSWPNAVPMSLLKALATVSSMTLLSRILGFVRDLVIARVFGAGLFTDAFFVAFKIPNLLRRLFAEGAFSQAFVPILAEFKNRRGEQETRLLVDHVAGDAGRGAVRRYGGRRARRPAHHLRDARRASPPRPTSST